MFYDDIEALEYYAGEMRKAINDKRPVTAALLIHIGIPDYNEYVREVANGTTYSDEHLAAIADYQDAIKESITYLAEFAGTWPNFEH